MGLSNTTDSQPTLFEASSFSRDNTSASQTLVIRTESATMQCNSYWDADGLPVGHCSTTSGDAWIRPKLSSNTEITTPLENAKQQPIGGDTYSHCRVTEIDGETIAYCEGEKTTLRYKDKQQRSQWPYHFQDALTLWPVIGISLYQSYHNYKQNPEQFDIKVGKDKAQEQQGILIPLLEAQKVQLTKLNHAIPEFLTTEISHQLNHYTRQLRQASNNLSVIVKDNTNVSNQLSETIEDLLQDIAYIQSLPIMLHELQKVLEEHSDTVMQLSKLTKASELVDIQKNVAQLSREITDVGLAMKSIPELLQQLDIKVTEVTRKVLQLQQTEKFSNSTEIQQISLERRLVFAKSQRNSILASIQSHGFLRVRPSSYQMNNVTVHSNQIEQPTLLDLRYDL